MIRVPWEFWPPLVAVLGFILALFASGHVVLRKRDSRSAAGWMGVIWLVPIVGSILYFLLGINRIRRHATKVHRIRPKPPQPALVAPSHPEDLSRAISPRVEHLEGLARIGAGVLKRPMEAGNCVVPLFGGDEAYPAMLRAIDEAQSTISLVTYIFDNDRAGHLFADALIRARQRGVAVRVLIDAVGARYTFPPIDRYLRRGGIPSARFMPSLAPAALPYLNLRNHRKIMVIDGHIGFTGGINIREGCMRSLDPKPSHPVNDLHFRLDGPVVAHLQEAFADDWAFTTGEILQSDGWFPPLTPCGSVLARGISAGPDEDFETLRWILLGAVSSAKRSIRIVTPYFLPDAPLINALNVAALRGVRVDVVLPEKGNLALVQWASTAQLWQILERGCRVHLSPAPFDHSKVMVVDEAWSLIGSANWDARSLRLNFEFNVECYDENLAARLDEFVSERIASGREITLADVDGRSLPVRLRDGVARLFSPYL